MLTVPFSTGAKDVMVFDHVHRRKPKGIDPNATGNINLMGPVQRVHVDQSYDEAPRLAARCGISPEVLSGRFMIVNVWRPIKTIRKDPFAVVDATSVPESDMVPIKLIYPDREGETFSVRPGKTHRWHYLSEQTPEDVLMFKIYDSKTDVARRVPHSAFWDEKFADEEDRESFEIRAIVMFGEGSEN